MGDPVAAGSAHGAICRHVGFPGGIFCSHGSRYEFQLVTQPNITVGLYPRSRNMSATNVAKVLTNCIFLIAKLDLEGVSPSLAETVLKPPIGVGTF